MFVCQAPVEGNLEFPCEASTLYDHWNPREVDPKKSPPPAEQSTDRYEMGDLSGKFGTLDGLKELDSVYNDTNLPIYGYESILGESSNDIQLPTREYNRPNIRQVDRLWFIRRRRIVVGHAAHSKEATVRKRLERFAASHRSIIPKAMCMVTCDSRSWYMLTVAKVTRQLKWNSAILERMIGIW